MNMPFHLIYRLIVPASVILVTVLAGLLLRNILFRRMLHWGKTTRTVTDDIIIAAVKGPFILWCLLLGVYLSIEVAVIPPQWSLLSGKLLIVLLIISITFTAATIATGLIRANAARLETALQITSLTDNIARIIIFSVGFLLILNVLGISIVPVLATLGVAGLAVGLALQDTFGNLFSGFHIILSKQIRIGDYIKLDGGTEGYVSDISWRTTKVLVPSGNLVLVPNSKMTQSIITDYCLPVKEAAVAVALSVAYDSDLTKVERVTREVAADVMETVAGGVKGYLPAVRFEAFGERGIGIEVSLRVREVPDQYLVRSEFVKRLHSRYGKEGIAFSSH
jgi:small-conductance mechanosensitive channel